MIKSKRAWLIAALVAFFGSSCAPIKAVEGGGPQGEGLRVEVLWRVGVASDRGWELDPREMGEVVVTPGGDLLVGASNGWVYRLIPNSGEVVWSTPVGGSIDAAGAMEKSQVFIGTSAGELVSLDWRDGEELWRWSTRGSIDSTPAVADGRVFVTDSEDVLYALDAESGELLWDYQREAPGFFTILGSGQPLPVGTSVYCGFADGMLVALQAQTGDPLWEVHLGDETGEFGDIDLPLIQREDSLVATSHSGGVYAVEMATGALLWRAEIANVVGVASVQGRIYAAATTGKVFALDGRNGEILWEVMLGEERAPMGLSSTGRFLAIPISRGPMVWLRADDGQALVKWAPSSGFQRAPRFDETRGYVMSNRGYLYGFGLAY